MERTLNILITAKDEATREINNLSGAVERNRASIKKTTAVASAAFAGLTAFVVKGTNAVGQNADRLLDLNAVTGISTDSLQEFENVARVAGVSQEALTNAISGLSRRMSGLIEGTGNAHNQFQSLGISVRDANGNIKDTENLMLEAMRAIGDLQNPMERAAAANQIFGRRWEELAPIMALGTEGIEAAREEARELGLVLSDETLHAANDMRIEMQQVQAQFGAVRDQLIVALIPAVTSLVESIQPVIENIARWIRDNPTLVRNIVIVTGAVTGLVAIMGALALAMAAISPVTLAITAGIAALGALIVPIMRVLRDFRERWENLRESFNALRNMLPDFVQKGLNILLLPLRLIGNLLRGVVDVVNTIFRRAVDTATSSTQSFSSSLDSLESPLSQQTELADNFSDAIKGVGSNAEDTANKIKSLRDEAQSILDSFTENEKRSRQDLAELIVQQEQGVLDKEREIRKLKKEEDSQANRDRIRELQKTIDQERAELDAVASVRKTIAEEIAEAERRASMSAFERKVEDIQKERIERLKAQVTRLAEIQQEIKAEEAKNQAIANSFTGTQGIIQKSVKETGDIIAEQARRMRSEFDSAAQAYARLQTAAGMRIQSVIGNAPRMSPVNDAVISPRGDIITTHPDDFLIATKDPSSLGAGGGVTVIVNGDVSGEDLIDKVEHAIIGRLQHNVRLTSI